MTAPHRVVSRRPIVALVCLCLVAAGVAIPAAAHLPTWIEAEFVLVTWWLVWVVTLTSLLYRGWRVDDDTAPVRFPAKKTVAILDTLHVASGCGIIPGGEGCLVPMMVVFGVLLAGLALAFLIELIIPAIALLLLASIGGMMARVANDTHGCYRHIVRSVSWAALWATIYVGPIAAFTLWVAAIAAK